MKICYLQYNQIILMQKTKTSKRRSRFLICTEFMVERTFLCGPTDLLHGIVVFNPTETPTVRLRKALISSCFLNKDNKRFSRLLSAKLRQIPDNCPISHLTRDCVDYRDAVCHSLPANSFTCMLSCSCS